MVVTLPSWLPNNFMVVTLSSFFLTFYHRCNPPILVAHLPSWLSPSNNGCPKSRLQTLIMVVTLPSRLPTCHNDWNPSNFTSEFITFAVVNRYLKKSKKDLLTAILDHSSTA
ncbi:hypothetical protein RRG08_016667 [Elysia crispata]|uniref:Uncharacterized protein n=1 Tax=Elysia crispata TaxID=231223 RepID=A0AAE0XRK1_9GAST|nr:hypothetical protein RRG08_016667 [Elysia crispata]